MHITTLDAIRNILRDLLTEDEFKEFNELLSSGLSNLSKASEDNSEKEELKSRIQELLAQNEQLQNQISGIKRSVTKVGTHLQAVLRKRFGVDSSEVKEEGPSMDWLLEKGKEMGFPALAKELGVDYNRVYGWFVKGSKPNWQAQKRIVDFWRRDQES